jgi:hypothetical protein
VSDAASTWPAKLGNLALTRVRDAPCPERCSCCRRRPSAEPTS